MTFDLIKIEEKWSKKWIEEKVFTPDLKEAKNPYFALFMFPYPSAEGLHIGNFYAFTCIDILAKYEKLRGKDVFEPFGFDAFGIHSENYALKIGETPQKMLERTKKNFRRQVMSAGLGCDFTREVDSTDPKYYKWTQWIFTEMYKRGLAFQKTSFLNWCPDCKTVLADEQIEGGCCERCGATPKKKNLKQWFLKITDYADRLLYGLDKMDWSEVTKAAQRNWIGRSEGVEVKFKINNEEVFVFTTRPDTLFGCTYFVLAPEHFLVEKITTKEKEKDVKEYVRKAGAKSDLERIEDKEKTGVFTGSYAINPVNNKKVPVWVADYVLINYGTGAIMAVPAHDNRDFEFATKHNLDIVEVVSSPDSIPYVGEGKMINSEKYNGKNSETAREEITKFLCDKKIAEKKVNYKLRDWCISRQRYWGPPIPIIHCKECGAVPVKKEDLPVVLPKMDKKWEPSGDGKGPLSQVKEFVEAKCSKCNGTARRETDVMDNFLDSAWYFFRYLSPDNKEYIFDKKLGKKWLPVDIYIGGNEHAVLHLMYARFITMFFNDIGLINFDDPFIKFRANGMVLKDGKKMSKSKGNVVNPEEIGSKMGYDVLKTYLLFLGPLCDDKSFSDEGIFGVKRWVEKVVKLEKKVKEEREDKREVLHKIHKGIKKIEEDFKEQKYNTIVAQVMEITNTLSLQEKISKKLWLTFLPLTAPLAPALAEEMWERAGNKNSIFTSKVWPEIDKEMLKEETIKLVIQVNGKVRDTIIIDSRKDDEFLKKVATESDNIRKWIDGKKIKKIIVIKGRLVNIVVS